MDGKLLCQLAGLADGAVVLFIRVELLSLAVETEGLVEKPGAALHIGKTEFLKRLVPCAGEFLSIFQHCSEAELARLGGVDVKKGDRITEDIPGFPVGYRDQENLRPNQIARTFLKSQAAERLDGFHQAVMAVNGKGSLCRLPFSSVFRSCAPSTQYQECGLCAHE